MSDDSEAKAGAAVRVRRISLALEALGHEGTDHRIAAILGTHQSTVWRWRKGLVAPRGEWALSLAILGRLATHWTDVPKGRKKLRGLLLEELSDDSREREPKFCPFRGYEGALRLLGWDELVPNRCEWDLKGAVFRPKAKR